ncbi:MAG: NAD-dependent epimerase/dehydratase family protein [Myxococcota bacterium]
MSEQRVFVTGGSGFVGGHVIEALSQRYEVGAMARSDASARKVAGFGARPVRTDLDTVTADDLRGYDLVVHSAAYVEEWGPAEAYERINVAGTARLLRAAQEAGVRRFVLVSTNVTVFDGHGQRDVDEDAPYPEHGRFHYARTKAAAERLVLDADREGFTTLAVRPCFVWGPRDNSVLPALRRMVHQGGFVWLDGGRALVSTTHVHTLVAAVERALVAGRGGRAYFVADEGDVTIREFLQSLADADGLTLRGLSVPGGPVRTFARLTERLYDALGVERLPPVTSMAATVMSRDMTVRSDRARAELGWAPAVDRRTALRELAQA